MNDVPKAWVVYGPGRRLQAQLHRLGLHPGAAWSLAWVLLFAGGIALDPMNGALERAAASTLAALFAGLTWVGALAFAGRRAPAWILPAAFGMGLARAAVWGLAGPSAGAAVSLLYEPAAMLAAAVVIWRADLLRGQSVLRLALTAAFCGLALVEIVDGIAPSVAGVPQSRALWMVAAPIAAALELAVMWLWIAERELRIERAEDEQVSLAEAVERERRANALLRRKEAWLFDFFEKAPDMLLVLAPGTCEILRCNRRFSETLGHPRRELEGRTLFELIDPETEEQVRTLLGGSWRRVRNLLLRFERYDGSRIAVLANLALRQAGVGAQEVRAVLHDVTHLAPSVLSERTDPHRLLTENAAAGIFHADETGRCALVNPSFCELTGLTPDQARQGSWLVRVHPDDRRRVEEVWDRSVRDRTVFRAEHRLRAVTGVPPRVLTECIPVPDEDLGGFVGSMIRLSSSENPALLAAARRSRADRSSP